MEQQKGFLFLHLKVNGKVCSKSILRKKYYIEVAFKDQDENYKTTPVY